MLLELGPVISKEEVALADQRALLKLVLRLVKVHVRVQGKEEARDRIAVAVARIAGLVMDNPDGVLHKVLQALVQNEASTHIAEEVRARQGDNGEALLVQEEVEEVPRLGLTSLDLVCSEDGEERPVEEPCTLQENFPLGHLGVLEELVQLEDDVCSLVEFPIEDERREGAPDAAHLLRGHRAVGVLGHHATVMLQQLAAERVVAAIVLQLRIAHQAIDDIDI
mmetsp:Transcript_99968/g.214116  ORF Transcript_99968/g.214116 Transcript_99968/m.214116 type:complete len:223 (-) Transcript_99968:568-1236(-)